MKTLDAAGLAALVPGFAAQKARKALFGTEEFPFGMSNNLGHSLVFALALSRFLTDHFVKHELMAVKVDRFSYAGTEKRNPYAHGLKPEDDFGYSYVSLGKDSVDMRGRFFPEDYAENVMKYRKWHLKPMSPEDVLEAERNPDFDWTHGKEDAVYSWLYSLSGTAAPWKAYLNDLREA